MRLLGLIRQPRLASRLAGALLAVGLLAASVLYASADQTPLPSVSVSVTIDARHPGRPVPQGFLGLSFEAYSLPQIARYGSEGNFVGMLRSLGPGVLRFGGVTADTQVAWTDSATPKPSWATIGLQMSDFRRLRQLADRSGWHILLTIGLAHYDPHAAAREAAAAKSALGPWLAGIELGNEPDSYARHNLRSTPWTPARYDAQIRTYRRAITKLAPGIALAGPDVSGSAAFEQWGPRTAVAERPALLTGHHYPLGCRQHPRPTIERLLSPGIRRAEDESLHRYLTAAAASHIPFRLDEANSVSCGGQAGTSNTFTSALWATDYIAHTMTAGATGINLQGNPANCHGYTPVCATTTRRIADGALTAQPVWYALLLDRELIGDRPVRATVSTTPSNLDVIALLSRRQDLDLVIVDDDPPGSRPAAVQLHVGRRFRTATSLSLTAPSFSATTGLRLGGQGLTNETPWRLPDPSRKPIRDDTVTLDCPPASATLVTIMPK